MQNSLDSANTTPTPAKFSRRQQQSAPDIQALLAKLTPDNPALLVSLRDLRLSVRATNVLSRMGVKQLGDLLAYNDLQLLAQPAFGHKCLVEVKSAILLQGNLPPLTDQQWGNTRRRGARNDTSFQRALESSQVRMVAPGENLVSEIQAIVDILVEPTRQGVPADRVERNRRVICERYGLTSMPRTLEDLGQEIGTTRERARQIIEQSMRRGAPRLLYAVDQPSHLARLLQALRPGSTPRVRNASDGLNDLLGPSMTLFDAAQFFEDLLGVDLLSEARKTYTRSRYGLTEDEEHELGRDLRATAAEIIEATGAVHFHTILAALYQRISGKLTAEQVRSILSEDRRLEDLPGQDGWLWFGPARWSRFQAESEKMLITAGGRVDLYALQAKYREMRSRRDAHRLSDAQLAVLPLDVAKCVMNATGFARQVQYNDYVYTGSRTIEDALTPVELALVRSIEELGGAGSSFEVARYARDQHGVLLPTAIMGLQTCTVVQRIDFGAFVVFGRPIAPLLERLREVTATSRHLHSIDGAIELRTAVTSNYLRTNCHISLPKRLGEMLEAQDVKSIVEECTGLALAYRTSRSGHYLLGGTRLMHALSAREGQTLVLVIDADASPIRAAASLE